MVLMFEKLLLKSLPEKFEWLFLSPIWLAGSV